MKYLLKDYRGYISDRTEFIDTKETVEIEFEFENGKPELVEQGIYVLITDNKGKERKYVLLDNNKIELKTADLYEGLFSVTVVLVTGNEITKYWRCEPFCLSKLTSAIEPLLDVAEMIEVTEEIKEMQATIQDLQDRVDMLENNYDPRNI